MKKGFLFLILFSVFGLIGCDQAAPANDEASVAQTVDAAVAQTVAANAAIEAAVEQTVASSEVAQTTEEVEALPATSTTVPEEPTAIPTEPPPATNTAVPTVTTVPTETPIPATETPEPTPVPPTNTPAPVVAQPTSPPAPPPAPEFGQNILANGSFEDGWYNLNGIAELQIPNGWGYEWDVGPTGFGDEPWDKWVRPETRVLPDFQLPTNERPLFIRDGIYTIKMFKGNGAISYRLFQDIELQPGTYVFEVNIFPDLVASYDGGKQAPGDPAAGEIRFIAPDGGTGWFFPAFAQWNTLQHVFTVDQAGAVRIGVGVRGRYALSNNGWFLDQWSLRRIEN